MVPKVTTEMIHIRNGNERAVSGDEKSRNTSHRTCEKRDVKRAMTAFLRWKIVADEPCGTVVRASFFLFCLCRRWSVKQWRRGSLKRILRGCQVGYCGWIMLWLGMLVGT